MLVGAVAAPSASAAITTVPVGTFDHPMYVTGAPRSGNLLFVVERRGVIQVLRNEAPTGAPFLDISSIVLGPPDPGTSIEQGLLSVAFPPDYDTSGRFYVCFTNVNGDVEVDEFRRSATDPTKALPGTRRPVLVVPHPDTPYHNGGQLQFGPDGYLYLSTGDEATGGSNAPDLNVLLGKLLRIDPRAHGASAYRVPSNNPFVGKPGRDEIYAYGFRNPWRFSFDGGRIAIGDVGETMFEEINYLPVTAASGANFGWPEYEGFHVYDPSFPGAHPVTFPVLVYGHANGNCAVMGGYVVRDPNLPSLRGRYLYGDYCRGWLRSFVPQVNPPAAVDNLNVSVARRPELTSLGQGPLHQIYLTQYDGEVSRLVETP